MSNALLIYNQLCASGLTHAGALGLLGNFMAESGLEPNRLQGDFSPNRSLSRAYTADVTAGRISRTQFSRDQKGYGLAQWTYFNFSTGEGRKLNLYDFWKKSGKALDDVSMQVSFALHELSTEGQYASLWKLLKTTRDIYTAVEKVCRLYEQPYFLNIDARFRYARELEAEIERDGLALSTPSDADKKEADAAASAWPPRMIDKSMHGADVSVLQALLLARGLFTGSIDGVFGSDLDEAVRRFQTAHGLDADGVCGPLTWGKLLSMEV